MNNFFIEISGFAHSRQIFVFVTYQYYHAAGNYRAAAVAAAAAATAATAVATVAAAVAASMTTAAKLTELVVVA